MAAVLEAADREGVGWDDVEDLDERAVYARLFPGRGEHESVYAQPDWRVVHRELARVGHKAGQSVEVDWSGPTMSLTDPVSGQVRRVFLFVGCLPFSRFAFVEPTLDMRQDTWLRAHVTMFDRFGGSVPRIVPDNLKTGVIKHPAQGEVVLNDAYRELAAHYSAAVLPGRVKKPKDYPEDSVIPSLESMAGVSCGMVAVSSG